MNKPKFMPHYNVHLDTFGGVMPDGSKAVCLVFTDKELGEAHAYPIPIEVAEDLADEIKRLAWSTEGLA